MDIMLLLAVFALGFLIGQTLEERGNRKAHTITTTEFCEQVADKIVRRIKEG